MADFCRQCSDILFGQYFGDLSNLITKEEVDQGLGAVVLCENCGTIMVNHEGTCLENHTHALEFDDAFVEEVFEALTGVQAEEENTAEL